MTGWRLAGLLALFATGPAAAQELVFSSTPSAGLAHAKAAMSEESGAPNEFVSVAHVDFNKDGRDDIFAFSENSYFCGSAGCDPRIYVATKKGGWQEVPIRGEVMTNSAPGMWFLTNSWVNDWRVLVMVEDGADKVALTWEDGFYLAKPAECC
jgi:hypothetical protein